MLFNIENFHKKKLFKMSACCLNEFGQGVLLQQLSALCSIIHAAGGHFEQFLKHDALCKNIHFSYQLCKF